MFRRRRRSGNEGAAGPAPGSSAPPDEAREPTAGVADASAAAHAAPDVRAEGKAPRPDGPWDVSEVDLEDPAQQAGRVDLGGLLVRPPEGAALQIQVDERTGTASSALVVVGDAAVMLMAVAAPRSSGLWEETRPQIAADATRRGGTAEEASGPLGTEVRVVVPATMPDGSSGVQPSRVVGIDGPRWMLRATFVGRALSDAATFERLSAVVRDVVVVRGPHPMAPGDLIALRVPEGARREGQPPPPASPPARKGTQRPPTARS